MERILRKNPGMTGQQVGFLALRGDGAYGGYSLYNGFNFALNTATENKLIDAADRWDRDAAGRRWVRPSSCAAAGATDHPGRQPACPVAWQTPQRAFRRGETRAIISR